MTTRVEGYCVKYCLTQGIFRLDAELCNGGKYASRGWYFLKVGRDWFRSRDDAVDAARRMAIDRIASLKKSIEKMCKLEREPKWREK